MGGGLNDNRHSTLTQITPANVSGLKLAWTGTFSLPAAAAAVPEEGAALAYQGVLYMPDGLNAVQAIDGTTGKTLWYYNPTNDNPALLPAVRGVALGDGRVFEGQNDGNVVALDQTTGNVDLEDEGRRSDRRHPVHVGARLLPGHGDRGRFRR